MIARKDFSSRIGDAFGRLIVLADAGVVRKNRRVLCLCECGRQKVVSLGNLKSGHTSSCGCYNSELTTARNMAGRQHPEDFWAKLDRLPNGCWLWPGHTTNGYGTTSFEGRNRLTHRLAWELAAGPIPKGLHVCHRCDVRACCAPWHFFLGTAADNEADKVRKGRQAYGERNGCAKLTAEQAARIRSSNRSGVSLAREFGVTPTTICKIRRGHAWRSV